MLDARSVPDCKLPTIRIREQKHKATATGFARVRSGTPRSNSHPGNRHCRFTSRDDVVALCESLQSEVMGGSLDVEIIKAKNEGGLLLAGWFVAFVSILLLTAGAGSSGGLLFLIWFAVLGSFIIEPLALFIAAVVRRCRRASSRRQQ